MDSLTKQTADSLMGIGGEARGIVFGTDAEFVKRKGGAEALEKVEKKMADLGAPFAYKEIEAMEFYPFWKRVLSLMVIKETMGLDREQIIEMGRVAPKTSLLVKMFSRFFFSIEKTLKHASEMWSKHYTTGDLKAEMTEENKIVIELREIEFEPVFWAYLEGYLTTVVEMVVDAKVTKVSVDKVKEGYRFGYEWQVKNQ